MTDDDKAPSASDAERCIEIRKRCKRGELISTEEMNFCMKMNDKYPEWYGATIERVFNETVPFGSDVKWKKKP